MCSGTTRRSSGLEDLSHRGNLVNSHCLNARMESLSQIRSSLWFIEKNERQNRHVREVATGPTRGRNPGLITDGHPQGSGSRKPELWNGRKGRRPRLTNHGRVGAQAHQRTAGRPCLRMHTRAGQDECDCRRNHSDAAAPTTVRIHNGSKRETLQGSLHVLPCTE